MKTRIVTLAAAAALTGLFAWANALAERPDGAGPPGGDGGGKGKPTNPGGGKPSDGNGDLYADLIVLLRDPQGLPLLVTRDLVDGTGTVNCLQPIAAGAIADPDITAYAESVGLTNPLVNPADGKRVSPVPLGGTGIEGEECDVQTDYTSLVQEVLFGRLNLGRSAVKVLVRQLRDVTTNLAASTAPIQIDEAGRLVWYDATGAGIEVDSPGNNLAIHKELQVEGLLRAPGSDIVLPLEANPDDATGVLDHAAAALGAAAGKGDLVALDLVVYNNRVLDIANETRATGTLPTVVGDGITGQAGEVYVDYTTAGYRYTRSRVFTGCVRGLLVGVPVPGSYTAFSGTIMDCVFGSIDLNGQCHHGADFTGETAVHSFAQRADDARAVIAFVHDNAVAASTAILPVEQAGVDQAGGTAVCDDITERGAAGADMMPNLAPMATTAGSHGGGARK